MFDEKDGVDVFERLDAPIFLARRNGRIVTLHTTQRRGLSRTAALASAALKRHGVDAECKIVSHSARRLRSAKSLERLGQRFGSGEVIYDPTKFVARLEAVVDCAKQLREELGSVVRNVYLDAKRRALYVIVQDAQSEEAARAALVRRVAIVMTRWQASNGVGLSLAARIGVEPPRDAHLISVDNQSVALYSALLSPGAIARGAWAMGVAALFGASLTVPAAAREPAVSTPNFTAVAKFGEALDQGQADFGIKGVMPLGEQFGVQGEVGIGSNDYFGIGGHVFWRDPSWAMLGVWASFDSTDDADLTRFGAEADFYVERFTVGGRVGSQSGDVRDGAFGRVDVTFYATDDLALKVGGEFSRDDEFGSTGVEWHPAIDSLPSLSIFADGEWGRDHADSIMMGLSYHFGTPGTSLINRDRREDPWWVIFNHEEEPGRPYGIIVLPDNNS